MFRKVAGVPFQLKWKVELDKNCNKNLNWKEQVSAKLSNCTI